MSPAPRRILTWFSLLLFVPALLLAVPDVRVGANVEIKTKDGRTLTGKVVDQDSKTVTIKRKFGSFPVSRDNIKTLRVLDKEGGGEGKRVAIITLKDGTTLRGEIKDKGSYIELTRTVGGIKATTRVDRRKIDSIDFTVVQPRSTEEEEGAFPSKIDYGFGFEVERPGENWRFVGPYDPLMRVQLVREDKAAWFEVGVRGRVPSTRLEGDNLKTLKDLWENEIERELGDAGSIRDEVRRFQGGKVVHLWYDAKSEVLDRTYVINELRFFAGGVHYVLRLSVTEEKAEAMGDPFEIFQNFSFLGPVAIQGNDYIDYELGFRFTVPNPDWRVEERIVNQSNPVYLLFPSENLQFRVHVEPAGGSLDAYLQGYLKRRKGDSLDFRLVKQEDVNVGGVQAVDLRYEDYMGTTKLKSVRELVFKRDDWAIRLFSLYPTTSRQADAAQAAFERLFDSVRVLMAPQSDAIVARGLKAQDQLVRGREEFDDNNPKAAIRHLTQAIEAKNDYARALLIRGMVYMEEEDYRQALKDFDAVEEFEIYPNLDEKIGHIRYQQALAYYEEEEWERAERYLKRLFRRNKENEDYRKSLEKLYKKWHKVPLDEEPEDYDDAIKILREGVDTLGEETRLKRTLESVFKKYIRDLLKREKFYKARSVLRDMERYVDDEEEIEKQEEKIDRAEEKSKD